MFLSCSKDSTSDLDIEINLGENGSILITAQAQGAKLYRFSFGDGIVIDNTEGSYKTHIRLSVHMTLVSGLFLMIVKHHMH